MITTQQANPIQKMSDTGSGGNATSRHFQNKVVRFLRSKDPLVPLGLVVLVIGLFMFGYGFVPIQQAIYQPVGYLSVPIGQALTQDEAAMIFQRNYSGTAPVDNTICEPSAVGYDCYGYELVGMGTFYNSSLQYFGAILIAVGAASAYIGNKFEPLKPKQRHSRPIRIRIDEDICIANGVCVNLAPTVFQFKKQDRPSILAPLVYVLDPNGASNDEIIQAAEMCPTGAIIIEDEETGERIHPPFPEG